MSRILAIDYGKARTGLAISDPTKTLARAFKVSEGIDNLKKDIKSIIDLYDIDTAVIGLSKKSDGSIGEIGELAISFGEYLKLHFPKLNIVYFDEAMTTKQVEKYFIEMGMPLKKYKKQIDKYAAEIILQNYLNSSKI